MARDLQDILNSYEVSIPVVTTLPVSLPKGAELYLESGGVLSKYVGNNANEPVPINGYTELIYKLEVNLETNAFSYRTRTGQMELSNWTVSVGANSSILLEFAQYNIEANKFLGFLNATWSEDGAINASFNRLNTNGVIWLETPTQVGIVSMSLKVLIFSTELIEI